jgi:hypothetical protein
MYNMILRQESRANFGLFCAFYDEAWKWEEHGYSTTSVLRQAASYTKGAALDIILLLAFKSSMITLFKCSHIYISLMLCYFIIFVLRYRQIFDFDLLRNCLGKQDHRRQKTICSLQREVEIIV